MSRRPNEPRYYPSRKAYHVQVGGKQFLLAKGSRDDPKVKKEAWKRFRELVPAKPNDLVWVTDEEIRTLRYAPWHLRGSLTVLELTGCRPEELCRIKVEDIDDLLPGVRIGSRTICDQQVCDLLKFQALGQEIVRIDWFNLYQDSKRQKLRTGAEAAITLSKEVGTGFFPDKYWGAASAPNNTVWHNKLLRVLGTENEEVGFQLELVLEWLLRWGIDRNKLGLVAQMYPAIDHPVPEVSGQHPPDDRVGSGAIPLLRNRRGDPWTVDTLHGAFCRLRDRLGLRKELTPLAYRHAFAQKFLEKGGTLTDLAVALAIKVRQARKLYGSWAGAGDAPEVQTAGRSFREVVSPITSKCVSITDEENLALINGHGNDVLARVLWVLYRTGCRPTEVCTIAAEHLDREAKTVQIKNRLVMCDEDFFTWLAALAQIVPNGPLLRNRRGKSWTVDALHGAFVRVRDRLGLRKELKPMSFRHAYAIRFLKEGNSFTRLAVVLGISEKQARRLYGS